MTRCAFTIAYRGECGWEEPCPDHTGLRCTSCGSPATMECPEITDLVCGAPLCGDCEHRTEEFGFSIRYSHDRKEARA